jgi:uncharacterized membrane protein (DUF106 family)
MSLIGLPAFIEEILASIVIVFVISLIYRFLMNQNEIREIKNKIKWKI